MAHVRDEPQTVEAMIFAFLRKVSAATLAGWLLFQVQGRILMLEEPDAVGPAMPAAAAALEPAARRPTAITTGRDGHFAASTYATRVADGFFSPQDVQNWQERGALEWTSGQDAGAAPTTPGAASPLRPASGRSMTITAGRDGHFTLGARVNGKAVRFMIDTGASGVVLSREDAARVGLRPRGQDFTGTARTANGQVRYAPVVLRDLRVGALTLSQVEAVVNGGRLDVSLLGMDFLRQLKAYEVRNNRLVLYW